MGALQTNRTQQAYDYIISSLYSGQLKPGSRVTNRGIAKEVGTSFIPVREAFNRLVSEGLLSHQPGMGFFVPQISRQLIKEIYEERVMLETHAVRKICNRKEKIDVSEVCINHEKMSSVIHMLNKTSDEDKVLKLLDNWQKLDSDFHISLFRAAGNRRILELAVELQTVCQTVFHQLDLKNTVDWNHTHKEHGDLIEKLRLGDAVSSQEILSKHLHQDCILTLEKTGLKLQVSAT